MINRSVRVRTSSRREMGSTSSKPSRARPLRLRPVTSAAPMARRRSATFQPMSPVPRTVKRPSRMERTGISGPQVWVRAVSR